MSVHASVHAIQALRVARLVAVRANAASLEEHAMSLAADIAALQAQALRTPRLLSHIKLNVAPSGTSIETVDTYTLPGGTLAADGDAVEIEWLFQQVVANACTLVVEVPTGAGLLNDARAQACDRWCKVRIERITATSVRRQLVYMYGTGVVYNPAVLANIANATAAFDSRVRLTNAVAATDMKAVSRRVTYFPAVA